MTPTIKRIDPYPRSPGYAAHKPLLAFARRAAALLVPDFSPPAALFSRHEQPETAKKAGQTVVRLGDGRHGFKINYVTLSHPHWGFPVSDDVIVRAYGLLAGHSLSLRACIGFDGTNMVSYLQLQVEGPDEVRAVVQSFETEFNPNKG